MSRRKRSDSVTAQVETMRRVLDGAPMPLAEVTDGNDKAKN